MYSTVKETLEAVWVPFCISMMGFIVRVARSGISSWRTFISSLFCSAFSGIISHWFLAGSGIDTQIASAVIAMSGYCGGALIDAVSSRILREVKEVSVQYAPHIEFPSITFPSIDRMPTPSHKSESTDQEHNNTDEAQQNNTEN